MFITQTFDLGEDRTHCLREDRAPINCLLQCPFRLKVCQIEVKSTDLWELSYYSHYNNIIFCISLSKFCKTFEHTSSLLSLKLLNRIIMDIRLLWKFMQIRSLQSKMSTESFKRSIEGERDNFVNFLITLWILKWFRLCWINHGWICWSNYIISYSICFFTT